ncbi:MAG: methylated-DNA--[protein]-cysteine S-methyltransferase [Candidatus Latescibacterota bacterium]|nr:methylated-DNA--[protein]-cysteine S-methyltransferase [Candidatus Latescibacterota bacterium]
MNSQTTIQTRFGRIQVEWFGPDLSKIKLGRYVCADIPSVVFSGNPPKDRAFLVEGLIGYFEGQVACLPVPNQLPEGTGFQREVWQATLDIPFGETASYGEIAEATGRDTGASRAVGMALNQNPLPLVIPCHRVVSSTGDLTGFAAGLAWKHALLGIEVSQFSLSF